MLFSSVLVSFRSPTSKIPNILSLNHILRYHCTDFWSNWTYSCWIRALNVNFSIFCALLYRTSLMRLQLILCGKVSIHRGNFWLDICWHPFLPNRGQTEPQKRLKYIVAIQGRWLGWPICLIWHCYFLSQVFLGQESSETKDTCQEILFLSCLDPGTPVIKSSSVKSSIFCSKGLPLGGLMSKGAKCSLHVHWPWRPFCPDTSWQQYRLIIVKVTHCKFSWVKIQFKVSFTFEDVSAPVSADLLVTFLVYVAFKWYLLGEKIEYFFVYHAYYTGRYVCKECCGQPWVWHMFYGKGLWWVIPTNKIHGIGLKHHLGFSRSYGHLSDTL